MPFNLRDLELADSAFKYPIFYLNEKFPDNLEGFFDNSGKSAETWASMKKGSHQDYFDLIEAFYQQLGRRDPSDIFSAYASIGRDPKNNVAMLARLARTPLAVVQISAGLSRALNKDSDISISYSRRTNGGAEAVLNQTVLGVEELMYPEQVFGGMGYYEGLAPIFGLPEFKTELLMLQFPLDRTLKHYFPNEKWWEVSADGDIIRKDDGTILARSERFRRTEMGSFEAQHRIYRSLVEKEGLKVNGIFFGKPSMFGLKSSEVREINLDELEVLVGVEDVFTGNFPIIKKGVIYGGRDPAPTSVYKLQWEEEKGLRQKVIWFLTDAYQRFRSGSDTVRAVSLLADREAEKRADAERTVNNLKNELSERTAVAYEKLKEAVEDREAVRHSLHNLANKIVDLANSIIDPPFVFWLNTFMEKLEQKDPNLIKQLDKTLAENDFGQYLQVIKSGEYSPIFIGTVVSSLSDLIENDYPDEYSLLIGQREISDKYKEEILGLERFVRKIMFTERGKSVKDVLYSNLWHSTLEKFKIIGADIKIEVNIPEVVLRTNVPRLELLIENLTLNSLQAAREARGYFRINSESDKNKGIITTIDNSVAWRSAEQMEAVVKKMTAPGVGFSTKGDIERSSQRGTGQVLIVETLRVIGADYEIIGDYSKRILTQRFNIPKELIRDNQIKS